MIDAHATRILHVLNRILIELLGFTLAHSHCVTFCEFESSIATIDLIDAPEIRKSCTL
jgi:hypothetical protein